MLPSMIYQICASVLMMITLQIYHANDQTDSDPTVVCQVLLCLSRFLSGCSAGTGSVAATIYLTDISPRCMRGNIVTFHQLFIVIGILVGQIVGLPWLLGRHE